MFCLGPGKSVEVTAGWFGGHKGMSACDGRIMG